MSRAGADDTAQSLEKAQSFLHACKADLAGMERRLARAKAKLNPVLAYPKKPQESGRSSRQD